MSNEDKENKYSVCQFFLKRKDNAYPFESRVWQTLNQIADTNRLTTHWRQRTNSLRVAVTYFHLRSLLLCSSLAAGAMFNENKEWTLLREQLWEQSQSPAHGRNRQKHSTTNHTTFHPPNSSLLLLFFPSLLSPPPPPLNSVQFFSLLLFPGVVLLACH